MKTKSRFIMIVLVFVLAISLVSCGGGKPAGPVTIKVLTMQQAGPTVEEMDAIVAEFNEGSPDVKVEIEYVTYDALHDKITTAMASSPPAYDVFLMDDVWYAEMAKAGYVSDVTSKITQDMRDKVFTSAWDITSVGGKVYGMPWLLDTKYFFYNDKLLEEAGFSEPPTTWEELVEQAKVIKEKGIVEYPLVASWAQAEAAVADWVALLYGMGGLMVDDQGQPAFNNAAGVASVEWMVKSIDDGITNPASVSYLEEDVRNVFSQGSAVFALNWNYMYDLANNNAEESQITGQVKVAPIPVFAGKTSDPTTSINGSMGFSVAAKSPNVDAAWKYVVYLTSEDVQNRYSAHMLPIWQSSFEGESGKALASLNQVTTAMVPAFLEQFPYAYVRPKVPYYVEGSKALQLALQEALTKQKSPKEAMDAAAATWVELNK